MKSPNFSLVVVPLLALLAVLPANAASPFSANVTFLGGPPIYPVNYSTSDALFQTMFFSSLQTVKTGYTGDGLVAAVGNYRRVNMNFDFTQPFANELLLTIDSLGITQQFNGGGVMQVPNSYTTISKAALS